MTSLDLYCTQKLNKLEHQKISRELKNIDILGENKISFNHKVLTNFSSNDYFGLAEHPELMKVAKSAIDRFGIGAKSSRLICGNHELYEQLESKLANFVNSPKALVFGSGYLASSSVVPVLCDRHDLIIADKLIHSCLLDGAMLSKAKFLRYEHNNLRQLEKLILDNKAKYKKILIITETIFSMDGDHANINQIIEIAKKYKSIILSDNAHGFGLNEKTNYYEGHIKLGTLSKGIGCYGGYVAGSEALCSLMLNKARGFIYSTALPASIIAAAIKAIELIEKGDVVEDLKRNIDLFSCKAGLSSRCSPIFVKKFVTIDQMQKKHNYIIENGFYTGAIRPPTVKEPRLRISISATHDKSDLVKLAELL